MRTVCDRTDGGDVSVGHVALRNGQRRNVGHKISAGVVAVEHVEELGERVNLPALADLDRAADTHVHLDVGRSAEIVELGRLSIHRNATAAVLVGDRVGTGALGLRERSQFEPTGDVHRTGEHKAVARVFAGRSVVAGGESIERIANAIYIVEEFAKDAAPCFRLRERVVRSQAETAGDVALDPQHEGVVAGAVVGFEESEFIEAVASISVVTLFVRIVRTRSPVLIEGMLHAACDVDRVRRLVAWVDVGRRTTSHSSVNRLKRSRPSALRQIVVEHAEPCANHRLLAATGRVGDSEARCDLLMVVMRDRSRNPV